MTVLATLDAAGLGLVLSVEGYEFPQFDSGWDANWLVCDVELDVGLLGSFHAHHRRAILTVEFERFRDQLRVLDETLAGTAALEHTEEQVGLTVRINAGKGTVEGFLADGHRWSVELREHRDRPVMSPALARAVRRDRRGVPRPRRPARVSRRQREPPGVTRFELRSAPGSNGSVAPEQVTVA